MLQCGMMEARPTPKNEREGEGLGMGICGFWKAARLMRLRATPPQVDGDVEHNSFNPV
jgi:hypothetical protein